MLLRGPCAGPVVHTVARHALPICANGRLSGRL